ncbi:MAG TPA: 3-dehydroquinate synthase [Allosphingosinicella sp.]|jgi:3-dehydroquinate synthase|nr:3-dehydroquinate synthase [Allosphingosinicella sp.]
MKRVEVALGARSYDIWIGDGVLGDARALLGERIRGERVAVVTDETVWAAQGERLRAALGGFDLDVIAVPAGERSKSWEGLSDVLDRLLALGIERSDTILAFGGGMVGDLAGFAASLLKRGCSYVQVPTTLLAQVDSSVGGKTAINVPAGKNLVGAFHQPSMVLIDPATLETLPPRELRAGYAEVVKYGLIGDEAFFAWCEAYGAALLGGDVCDRLYAIEACVRAKAGIVAEDERETTGRRALLNLGHTFGHALEAETGFSDRLLHGEAVALGMALAFRFSARRGLCAPADAERVEAHLAASGLPTRLDIGTPAALVEHMRSDKKAAGGRVPFILAREIGGAFVDHSVEPEEVEGFLSSELG